ncbi:probable nuclear transport factor 2 [Leptopilina heterotoma]|uniref:probable nuclear transport factor 2 n=1 Tax=Leptopilina heterotoma TaxID=63436 RepID=UPI001CA89E2A|nr:probable nuclear transport factor 2 [Leptopilina heterotoma]
MATNIDYERLSKEFVQHYYNQFDDPAQRRNLTNMYDPTNSLMTFEGAQIQGSAKIMEKLNSLSFNTINRIVTTVDSQPMPDGGILINVVGRLKADDDPPHSFSQVFVLKSNGNNFFCQHDIFRLDIHDSA